MTGAKPKEPREAKAAKELVRFSHVTRAYAAGAHVLKAVDDVSFSILAGEFVVILGPSGAGKTTLLNLLGGMDPVTSGSIVVDGQDIAAMPDDRLAEYRAAHVGFVFQFYNLIPSLTALENIALTKKIVKEPLDAAYVLGLVGLADHDGQFPAQLSGGEQQRVCIARALINYPQLILADEPTGNLDEANEAIVLALLRRLHEEGSTIVVVTHSPGVAAQAERTVVLEHGRIAQSFFNR